MSDPTFTTQAAKAAQSVHNWTRFAALMTATAGSVMLLATLIVAALAAARLPQLRGLIAAIGTIYAIGALAMLCFSFLLVRYGQKLEMAANLRNAGPLVDALPYETGIWSIVAGYVAITMLSIVISVASPTARQSLQQRETATQTQVQPMELDDPEALATKIRWISGAFAAVGLVLLVSALKPVAD
jgi:hypothetical protein